MLLAYQTLILTSPPSLKISVSTAEVERGFSALNRIKTDTRATMTQEPREQTFS